MKNSVATTKNASASSTCKLGYPGCNEDDCYDDFNLGHMNSKLWDEHFEWAERWNKYIEGIQNNREIK